MTTAVLLNSFDCYTNIINISMAIAELIAERIICCLGRSTNTSVNINSLNKTC